MTIPSLDELRERALRHRYVQPVVRAKEAYDYVEAHPAMRVVETGRKLHARGQAVAGLGKSALSGLQTLRALVRGEP